ncbi:glycosyltransferase [Aquamicrobium sp. LC103]|uniref:glycosyltransferase family 4 protein n=1 Tax=Aquamicrobium sp. LC103 TaxID=1120658 RepID=UPI00063EAB45|nr:glycosyltransferase [Aquamicrobium sp. LC103]
MAFRRVGNPRRSVAAQGHEPAQAAGTRAKDVLFLAQLPPPLHGQSAISAAVHETLQASGCGLTHVWGGGAAKSSDVGKRRFGKYLGFAGTLAKLAGMIAAGRRYDLAYVAMAPWAHTAMRDAILAGFAGRLAPRVLVHVHGEGIGRIAEGTGWKHALMRKMLAGTELVAVTEGSAAEGRASGLFSHVEPLANFAPDPGSVRRRKSDAAVIGTLCNLDPRKGVFEFVEAICDMRDAGLPVKGRIMGGSTAELTVEDLKRHVSESGLDDLIEVTGPVGGGEKSRQLAATGIFLYLSRHDLAPLVLIEAMAHGCVPLVLDVGGIAEMMGAELSGNVFDAGMNHEELAGLLVDKVRSYIEAPEKFARDSEAARRRYETNFSESNFRESLKKMVGV